jgi:hypothetical protein
MGEVVKEVHLAFSGFLSHAPLETEFCGACGFGERSYGYDSVAPFPFTGL